MLCALGVEPNGSPDEGAQFEHLWIAVLLAAVGPCVPLVLMPFLIPDARQTDTLLKDGGSEKGATPPGATRRGELWGAVSAASARSGGGEAGGAASLPLSAPTHSVAASTEIVNMCWTKKNAWARAIVRAVKNWKERTTTAPATSAVAIETTSSNCEKIC